mmetsp:Transcript_2979/g.9122  ORF Transcript_2979/g.9122 Transcript_2979/m.9122 type:complete len:166 (-) Transcript_2979:110-607(-)
MLSCFGGKKDRFDSDSQDSDEQEPGTVRLKVRGVDLPKKKNPFVVVFFHQGASDFSKRKSFVGDRGVTKNTAKWTELGRTEVIASAKDPHFRRPFTVPYNPDLLQELRIEFYSELTKTLDLNRQEFIGAAEVRLIDICEESGTMKTPLANVLLKNCGSTILTVKK